MVPHTVRRLARQHALPLTLLVLLAAAAGALSAGLRPAAFQAEGQLLLAQAQAADQLGVSADRIDADRYVANQIEVLTSQPVVDGAVEAGGDPDALDTVSVSQDGESDLVSLRATADHADAAAAAVNATMASYVQLSERAARAAVERQAAELEAQLLALADRLAETERRLAAGDAVDAGEEAVLAAQRTADLGTYAQLSVDRQRLEARAGLAQGRAEVVQAAAEAEPVAGPGPATAAAGAGVAMAVLAMGALVGRERVLNRVTSRLQIEGLDLDVPVLGELPTATALDDGSGLPLQQRAPDGQLAGSVRLLRRAIDMRWEPKPSSVLLVTSPGRQDGRTTVVANLATAYARAGIACLAVDADIRRAGLSAALDLSPEAGGIAPVLSGQLAAHEATVDTPIEGLRALPAGPVIAHPVELFGTERAATSFADAAADEIVLVDGPPVLGPPDGRLLAAAADAVLVIVRAGQTSVRDLEDAVEAVRSVTAAPVAVVVNQVPPA